jgi:hypothetical protein
MSDPSAAAPKKGNNTRKNNRRNAFAGIYVPEEVPVNARRPVERLRVNLPVERNFPTGIARGSRLGAGIYVPESADDYGKLDYSKIPVGTHYTPPSPPYTNAGTHKTIFLDNVKFGLLGPDGGVKKTLDNFDETGRYLIAVTNLMESNGVGMYSTTNTYLIFYDNHGQKYKILVALGGGIQSMSPGQVLTSFDIDDAQFPIALPPALIDQIKLMVYTNPTTYHNKDFINWSPVNHISHL